MYSFNNYHDKFTLQLAALEILDVLNNKNSFDEGVFRISIDKKVEDKYIHRIDHKKPLPYSSMSSIELACVLKRILRELKQSDHALISPKGYDSIREVRMDNAQDSLSRLRKELPSTNQMIFFKLMRLLGKLQVYEKTTLMTAKNLSISIGPTLVSVPENPALEIAVIPYLENWMTDKMHFGTCSSGFSLSISNYNEEILSRIKTKNFEVAYYPFWSGGLVRIIEGKKVRLPHRVAEIYDVLMSDQGAEYKYLKCQHIAETALKHPKGGRKIESTSFYQSILDSKASIFDYHTTAISAGKNENMDKEALESQQTPNQKLG